jgi:hypothetical protein
MYFFSFKDSYGFASNQSSLEPQQQQHQQQTTVSLRLGDKYKRLKFVDEGYKVPSQLKRLVKTLENITKVDQLSGIDLYKSK